MKIGMTAVFHNPYDKRADGDVYETDLALAALAEPLGYDSLWTVEHHFDDYCLAPDPFQILSYFAARTERILLGSMVVVLPWWHDPIRIAEKAALLDYFCQGRFLLGVGRGASYREFDGFGVPMEESRDRFVESATMILAALESGVCEFDGKYVKQARTTIRPKPRASFVGRRYAAAVSPESAEMMARLGLALLVIPQKPWPLIKADVASHRAAYVAAHGSEPPPCVTSLLVYCDEDRSHLEAVTRDYVRPQAENVARHYDFAGPRANVKGYESYGKVAPQDLVDMQVPLQIVGTPEECYRKLVDVQRVTGTDHFSGVFSFAGLPRTAAERSIRLFAREVLPELQKLGANDKAA